MTSVDRVLGHRALGHRVLGLGVLGLGVLILGLGGSVATAQTETPKPAAAGSPAPAGPAPSTPDAAGLTGIAAWEKLKGNTIAGKIGGQAFAEFFEEGGGVRYVDKDGLSTGTWALQGTKVCFDFPDDDDRSCATFTVTGTSGTAVDDDNMTTKFEILPGNNKGL